MYVNKCFRQIVSIPKPRTYEALRNDMKEGVKSGKYKICDLTEPKVFKKITIKDGKPQEETYQVHGQKIPLRTIQETIFNKHMSMGLMREKTIYNRKLLTWTDHADILSKFYFHKITDKFQYISFCQL